MNNYYNKYKSSIGLQMISAVIIGTIFGSLLPQFSSIYQFLGKAFISLVSMVILPLVFPVIVLSVAEILNKESLGKLILKSILYFFIITTIITGIFVTGSYLLKFGQGIDIGQQKTSLNGLTNNTNLNDFLLGIIPANIFKSLSQGSLLPVVVFAIFLGFGIGSLENRKNSIFINALYVWVDAIYKIVELIIKWAPFGVFGFIASDVATTGFEKLISLGEFVIGTYVAYSILALFFYPLLAYIFELNYFQLIKSIWNLLLLAFISGSSSVVLPELLKRLKNNGSDENITDLVVPLGYTFNLQGAAVYFSIATIYIVNVYNINLSTSQIIYTIFILSLIGKTAATVPSGAIVVLLASATMLGLPKEGVALIFAVVPYIFFLFAILAVIFAVDFFVNAGRTALNVLGQGMTVLIIEKLNKKYLF